ncbi:MAG: ATP-binding cassette domain-containing protein, partial [Ilumatobacteraceae bacterium]
MTSTEQSLSTHQGGTVLDVSEVTVTFGGIVALDGLTFSIQRGHICGLIGPNGAGKTTMFNVVSRIYDPTQGSITYEGQDLLQVPAHGIARLGIARTFQNLALFPTMSLLENVMVGAHSQGKVGFVRSILRLGAAKENRE